MKVTGEQASASVEYEGSAIEGPYGTLAFVREGGVWKLDKLGGDFMRSTAVASAQALSIGALSIPAVQKCVAKQTSRLSDAAVPKYVHALYRLDQGAGRSALRLVDKCPKEVAVFVAEEPSGGSSPASMSSAGA